MSGFPRKHAHSLQRRPSLAFGFGTFADAKDQASLPARRFAQENPTPCFNNLIGIIWRYSFLRYVFVKINYGGTIHSIQRNPITWNQLNTLGWELTVCNALYPEGTPLRKLLTRNEPFGHLLYDYLSKLVPMGNVARVLEIGGGYGYLMKDFLERNRSLTACMLDISPVLLGKQKETLKEFHWTSGKRTSLKRTRSS